MAVFFVGLAEVGLELGHCSLAFWLGSTFLTFDGEEAALLDDVGAFADSSGDGDGISAFRANFMQNLSCSKRLLMGVGGYHGALMCTVLAASWLALICLYADQR